MKNAKTWGGGLGEAARVLYDLLLSLLSFCIPPMANLVLHPANGQSRFASRQWPISAMLIGSTTYIVGRCINRAATFTDCIY
jgi:hypothetical protein